MSGCEDCINKPRWWIHARKDGVKGGIIETTTSACNETHRDAATLRLQEVMGNDATIKVAEILPPPNVVPFPSTPRD